MMGAFDTADGQNPALPIIKHIYHNSHSFGSLGSCRILSINSIVGLLERGFLKGVGKGSLSFFMCCFLVSCSIGIFR